MFNGILGWVYKRFSIHVGYFGNAAADNGKEMKYHRYNTPQEYWEAKEGEFRRLNPEDEDDPFKEEDYLYEDGPDSVPLPPLETESDKEFWRYYSEYRFQSQEYLRKKLKGE